MENKATIQPFNSFLKSVFVLAPWGVFLI